MENAEKNYIINTVFKTNILPILSECNTSCIFCSHRQNPDDIEVFRMPKMELRDFEELIDFLSPEKKIIIGESATRIIEGEPLLHKDFIGILRLIRKKYGRTPIQITTNALLLDEAMLDEFTKMGNIELNISINSIHPEKRKRILGLRHDDGIIAKINMLKGKVRFSGSLVMIPGLTESTDIEEIAALLFESGAESVRLFLPGYTFKSPESHDLFGLYVKAVEIVSVLRKKIDIPIIIEPSLITNLNCRIEGIIRNTPAHRADLREGDVISSINGVTPQTRVDAFNMVFRSANPSLNVLRGTDSINVRLMKAGNSAPGFIVLYDIDSDFVERLNNVIERYAAKSVLLLTSELAIDIIEALLGKVEHEFSCKAISVRNEFFGGNIKCAGLLVINDLLKKAEDYLADNERPDLILIPPVMLDFKKRDLTGRDMKYMEERLGITVDTI